MSPFGRLRARIHGEAAAGDLDGYRRAGAAVYDLVAEVEQRRTELTLAGGTPWSFDAATQLAALCAWNAFVLQSVGDAYLDAHDQQGQAGFAGEQTREQVLGYYAAVPGWVRRGHEAETGAATAPAPGALPAALPGPAGAWRQPYPDLHVRALLHALDVVATRADASARELLAAADAGAHQQAATALRQRVASARSLSDYATQLTSARPADDAQTAAGRQAHAAVDAWFQLGQLVAMPALLDAEGEAGVAPVAPSG